MMMAMVMVVVRRIILAQEFLSDDDDGDGDGEKNHEPGCVKCIKYYTKVMAQVANPCLSNLKRSLCSISFRPDTWCKWLTWLPIMSGTSLAPSSSCTLMALSGPLLFPFLFLISTAQ